MHLYTQMKSSIMVSKGFSYQLHETYLLVYWNDKSRVNMIRLNIWWI